MERNTLLLIAVGVGAYLLYRYQAGDQSNAVYMSSFVGPTALDDANHWQETGGIFLRPDGTPYTVTPFMGGFLYDNLPINVQLGLGWLPGQQDALIDAGLLDPATA